MGLNPSNSFYLKSSLIAETKKYKRVYLIDDDLKNKSELQNWEKSQMGLRDSTSVQHSFFSDAISEAV